jgi:PTH1 family peptidyl-tRNA hydrolase
MHLVVGLGNPGPKYETTRHNIGFMVIDELVDRYGLGALREKFKGEFGKHTTRSGDVVLLKPQTFMNLSGESIQAAMRFFKLDLSKVIVIHDELDLEFGTIRVKIGGGTAGHNGLKSTIQHGGGNGFIRIRFGVGRPQSQRPDQWVLSDFSASDRAELGDLIAKTADIIEEVITRGPQSAMQRFH